MSYFKSPQDYEEQTGKSFTEECPNISKSVIKDKRRDKKPYWPHWADIVEYNTRLYWVNSKE